MSNPMPPPEFKPPQEKEKKEGLSQDDFRKLLATPRAAPGGPGGIKGSFSRSLGSANRTARAPVPQTPRSGGGDGNNNQKPKPKKAYNKNPAKEAAASKYRDRATERRQGINPDYVETEQILSTLEGAAADVAPEVLYEQSKFLGGDVEHTHLVKGLDFALLNKMRQEDNDKDPEAAAAMDLDKVFENVEKAAKNETTTKEPEPEEKPEMNSVLASNIFKYAIEEPLKKLPKVNEMFVPGRTVFVFEVPITSKAKKSKSGVVEDYNPYVVPTTVLRSRADVDQNQSATVENPENDMVMSKVLDVLQAIRTGERKAGEIEAELKAKKKAAAAAAAAKLAASRQLEDNQLQAVEPDEDGDDIFGDVGRDYEVEPANKEPEAPANMMEVDEAGPVVGPIMPEDVDMSHYFGEESDEEQDRDDAQPYGEQTADTNESEAPLLGPSRPSEVDMSNYFDEDSDKASGGEQDDQPETGNEYGSFESQEGLSKPSETPAPRRQVRLEELEVDEDADYYSAYGLGTGSRNLGNTAYDSDEDEDDGQSTILMDQGTHKNKRAQLSRFDFDTEEGFNRYKDTVEAVPKTAFQFGVKMSDGRKTGKWDDGKSKGLTKDEKLDRDWQRISRLMEKNSGSGSGGQKSNRRDEGSHGGDRGSDNRSKRRKNNNW
ncbi:hypothetical protein BGZ82_011344 [Podila clonocystis]|nr:hypothetical protein BGZ82_011344 [Podila clonocystis]